MKNTRKKKGIPAINLFLIFLAQFRKRKEQILTAQQATLTTQRNVTFLEWRLT